MDQKTYNAKRREIDLGLANNAFGATAGVLGTRAVYRQARAKRLPAREAKYQARVKTRQAARDAKGPTRMSRVASSVKARIPAKVRPFVAPALVGGAVAMQGVNAAADAQSASYFARERKNLMAKKPDSALAKSDSGMSTGVDIGKARWEDSNARRVNQQGVAAGALGTVGLAGGAVSGRSLLRTTYVPPKGEPLLDKNGKHRTSSAGKKMFTRPNPSATVGGALRTAGRTAMSNRKGLAGLGVSALTLPAAYALNRRSRSDGGRAWS